MNHQPTAAKSGSRRSRALVFILLHGIGLAICAGIILLFGLVPFLCGVIAQVLIPRRIPAYIAGPIAAAAFFLFWHFTGWVSFKIGDGRFVWVSVVLSLYLFVAFFASGAAFLRQLLPRRFTTPSASATPQ